MGSRSYSQWLLECSAGAALRPVHMPAPRRARAHICFRAGHRFPLSIGVTVMRNGPGDGPTKDDGERNGTGSEASSQHGRPVHA